MNSAQTITANYVLVGTTPFGDVPSTESFVSYIEAIYNNGITTGCGNGNYCPSDSVTRDQMAAFLVRATQVAAGQSTVNFTCNGGVSGASINCATTTAYFSDVPTTDQFFPYVQKLKELGITTGCGNGDYCPSDSVTRDQMAAFLVRATQVAAGQSTVNFTCNGGVSGASVNCATTTPYFSDVPTTDQFFPYVQKLYELGITTGCGNGNYCPSENVTRDQMAAFLSRAFLEMVPVISWINPTTAVSGSQMAVFGSGFNQWTSVMIGNVSANNVQVVSNNSLIFTVPYAIDSNGNLASLSGIYALKVNGRPFANVTITSSPQSNQSPGAVATNMGNAIAQSLNTSPKLFSDAVAQISANISDPQTVQMLNNMAGIQPDIVAFFTNEFPQLLNGMGAPSLGVLEGSLLAQQPSPVSQVTAQLPRVKVPVTDPTDGNQFLDDRAVEIAQSSGFQSSLNILDKVASACAIVMAEVCGPVSLVTSAVKFFVDMANSEEGKIGDITFGSSPASALLNDNSIEVGNNQTVTVYPNINIEYTYDPASDPRYNVPIAYFQSMMEQYSKYGYLITILGKLKDSVALIEQMPKMTVEPTDTWQFNFTPYLNTLQCPSGWVQFDLSGDVSWKSGAYDDNSFTSSNCWIGLQNKYLRFDEQVFSLNSPLQVNKASTYSISGTVQNMVSSSVALGIPSVTMTLSGNQSATVVTDAGGNYSFKGLMPGSYTITPSLAGYTFSRSPLTLTVNSSDLAGENFTGTTQLDLTVTLSGSGTGSVSSSPSGISCGTTCNKNFPGGTTVTLTATADSGSTLSSWSGCDSTSGNTCTVLMNAAKSVTATFIAPYTLTITTSGTGSGTVTASSGTISWSGNTGTASYNSGSTVTLTATPSTGSTFTGWSGGGCSGTGTCTVSMTAAESVTATFGPTYTAIYVDSCSCDSPGGRLTISIPGYGIVYDRNGYPYSTPFSAPSGTTLTGTITNTEACNFTGPYSFVCAIRFYNGFPVEGNPPPNLITWFPPSYSGSFQLVVP